MLGTPEKQDPEPLEDPEPYRDPEFYDDSVPYEDPGPYEDSEFFDDPEKTQEPMILGCKRIHNPRRTLSGFLRTFSMEICGSKVQIARPHGFFINGVANPKILSMLLLFQILCIDWFFIKNTYLERKFIKYFIYLAWVGCNHLKAFWKVDALGS